MKTAKPGATLDIAKTILDAYQRGQVDALEILRDTLRACPIDTFIAIDKMLKEVQK